MSVNKSTDDGDRVCQILEWLLYILTNDGIVKQGSILAAQVQESKKKFKKKIKKKKKRKRKNKVAICKML